MSIASARRLAAGLIVASSFALGATQPATASVAAETHAHAPAPALAAVAKTGDRAGGSVEVKGRKNTKGRKNSRASFKQRKDDPTTFRANGRKN